MSEQSLPLEERVFLQPRMKAIEALRRLPIVHGEVETDDLTSLQAFAPVSELSDGSYYAPFAGAAPIDGTLIDPSTDTKSNKAFHVAAETLRKDDLFYGQLLAKDSRWWETNTPELKRIDVENNLREVWRTVIHTTKGEAEGLDILNCSPDLLADDEHAAFSETLDMVSRLTEGKIHDRVKGIIFCGDGVIPNNGVAQFGHNSGVLLINISEARRYKGIVPRRYAQFFEPGDEWLSLKILLAHELGHAMGIRTVKEARSHGMNLNQRAYTIIQGKQIIGASAFDELACWSATTIEDDFSTLNNWRFTPHGAAESGEYPPTEYANTEPCEDEAESFAIIALKGNVSTIPVRHKIILRTIELAEGKKLPSHTLEIKKIAGAGEVFEPRARIGRVHLKALMQPPIRYDENGWPVID